jgi:tetratricopeptide (TPR) repeat protein
MDKNTSEIAKLTERISRDPKSKLFVPLAEEYKKSGDIEMAVHVLTEGLKNNPGYVTARSFLGRLLFEMGDMTAARREFEEVVKAVPDNLLAQKKLGDLHALLGNQTEALKYYNTARSLNPADAEIASLVSDLEAKLGIVKPIDTPAPEPAVTAEPKSVLQPRASEPERTEAPAEPAGKTSPEDETGLKKGDVTAPPTPDVSVEDAASGATSQVPPAAVVFEEPEEAEEVLVVEPLEEEFPLVEAPGQAPEEPGLLTETETTTSPAAVGEAAPPKEVSVAPAEPEAAAARTGDVSDDFTTDTLAELYIGQGFYEKAIDIYERMLADHPDSGALKDKLERVRSLAASAETQTPLTPEETAAAKADTAIFAEVPEPVPSAAPSAASEEITLDADLFEEPEEAQPDAAPARGPDDLFTEPKEYRPPPPEGEETAGPGDEKFFDAVMNPPATEFTATEKPSSAFEPREYIPPDAEFRMRTEEKERAKPNQAGAHRKVVIDRLEHWLKTIKKEI